MKPIAEVAMLTNQHEGTYGNCPGCAICERIEQLRPLLDRPPEERYKHILSKGKDMTKKDIQILIDAEVHREEIRQKLRMGSKEFYEMLRGWGLTKKQQLKERIELKKPKVTVTKEKLIQFENEGLSPKDIAKQIGVSAGTVYNLRNKYGLTTKADGNQEYKKAMNEVAAAIVANPDLTDKLKARISELEEQVMEQHRKYAELEAAAEDLEKENAENAKKARQMEEEVDNYAAEMDEWRERARSYAEDNERLNDANKDLRMMLQESQRKEKLYAAALKEAL